MPRLQGCWGVASTDAWAGALGSVTNETILFRNQGPATGLLQDHDHLPLRAMSDAAASSTSDSTTSDKATTDKAAYDKASSDSLEVIRKFAETYAQRTGTYFCSDPGVTAVVLAGLAKHKDELGGALCPCRHYEDKEAEVSQAFWNCPCVPMRERKECHCMLFLTEDNPFRGEQQTISLDDVKALTAG